MVVREDNRMVLCTSLFFAVGPALIRPVSCGHTETAVLVTSWFVVSVGYLNCAEMTDLQESVLDKRRGLAKTTNAINRSS